MNSHNWTHWYEVTPGAAVKCKIVKQRRGFISYIFGDVFIITAEGDGFWTHEKYLITILD